MKCRMCGDDMVERVVDVCYCASDRIVSGVPVLECETCGERVYRPDVAGALESMRSRPGTPTGTRMFNVFSFVPLPRARRNGNTIRSSETADPAIPYDNSPDIVIHEREAATTP